MKMKIVFTAEIAEDIGDVPEDKVLTEEQNREMLEGELREMCGQDAEIVIHDFKLTKET